MSDAVATPPPATESVVDRIERLSTDILAKKQMGQPSVEPAAAPVAPATPPPDDDFEIDGKKVTMPEGITSEKTKSDWRTWKGMAKTKIVDLEKKLADVNKRLDEAPKLETKKWEDKIAELEKERSELNQQLGEMSLERTPEFSRHYNGKLDAAFKEVRDIVGADKADMAESILRLPESQHKRQLLDELYSQLTDSQKSDVATIKRDITNTLRERSEKLSDWKNQMEAKRARDEKLMEASRGNISKAFEESLNEFRSDADAITLQAKDGDEEWNKGTEALLTDARNLFTSEDPKKRAGAAIAAASHKRALAILKATREENETLKKHISDLRAKVPDVKGGEGKPANNVLPGGKAESLAERIARLGSEAGFLKG